MRQFVYKPDDAGLAEWPAGTLRLDGIEVTEDPNVADVFVCPGNIRIFEKETGVLDMDKLNRLPYFKGNESLHVFFDVSDNFTKPINLPILFIKCDARTWMLKDDPNTIQMAWPVEDYSECIPVPEGGFKYDLTFHGWLSGWVDRNGLQVSPRKDSTEACKKVSRLTCDIAGYDDFCGYIYYQAEGIRRRSEFRRSMHESRIALCPESIPGVFPYRYFEAMSAGRVPLLVGSDFVYPFTDEIDYGAFTLTCSRDDADKAGEVAAEFLMLHSDEEIVEIGKLARQAWSRWLDSRNWPTLHAAAVLKKLGALQAA